MRQHYCADWAFGIQNTVEKIVRAHYPDLLRTWPILQCFNFENYKLSDDYIFIVLKDRLSGIPSGPDTCETIDFSVPSLPPKISDIPIWQHCIRQNFNLRPEDFVFIIPIRDCGKSRVEEDFKLFSAEEQYFWSAQINHVVSTYKAHMDKTMSKMQPTNVTYNVTGSNSRINVNSVDQSSNSVVEKNKFLFEEILELANSIEGAKAREAALDSIHEMEQTQGTASFVPAYQKFLSCVSDHITVFTPVLAALAGLLA